MRRIMDQISTKIKNKKLFLLDIDGTISFDSTLFDGSMDFLQQVNANGGKYQQQVYSYPVYVRDQKIFRKL